MFDWNNTLRYKYHWTVCIDEYQAVINKYRRRWTGIVLEERRVNDIKARMFVVLIILDRSGRRIRKRQIRIVNEDCVEMVERLDMQMNGDWLRLSTLSDQFKAYYKRFFGVK